MYKAALLTGPVVLACRSSFNGYTAYATWLLASLVYHVPSLEDLGINVRADLSMFFLCFVTTFTVRCAAPPAYLPPPRCWHCMHAAAYVPKVTQPVWAHCGTDLRCLLPGHMTAARRYFSTCLRRPARLLSIQALVVACLHPQHPILVSGALTDRRRGAQSVLRRPQNRACKANAHARCHPACDLALMPCAPCLPRCRERPDQPAGQVVG